MNEVGSTVAVARVAASSSVISRAPGDSATMVRPSVLVPTWRAPFNATTRVSQSAVLTASPANRRTKIDRAQRKCVVDLRHGSRGSPDTLLAHPGGRSGGPTLASTPAHRLCVTGGRGRYLRRVAPSSTVRLPLHVKWSGPRDYDLDDPADRRGVYEVVLREGSAADVRRFVDPAELARVIHDLVLPSHVRVALVDWLEARGRLPC